MTRLSAQMIQLCAVLGIAFAAWAEQPPLPCPSPFSGPITVDAAVQYALTNNPSITNAVQDVQISTFQIDSARANRRPTITANLQGTFVPSPQTLTFQGENIPATKRVSSNAQFTIAQPVWPPERWRAPLCVALANLGVSQEELTRTRETVAYQTRQAYYQYLTAQELRRVQEDAVLVARRQLELARSTVEAGLAAPLDIFQAQATLAETEVNLVQAQNNVALARDVLAIQLGLPAGTSLEAVEPNTLPALPASPDPLVAEALHLRPELLQLSYRKQQLCCNREIIRLEQRPLVNLAANYNQTVYGGSLFGAAADGASISVDVAWTLYNGGRTRAELNANTVQVQQIDTLVCQLTLGITQQVRQGWINLQNALEQLPAAQTQLAAANESLRISQLRYENGEGIALEVEQAQFQRTQAQTSVAQARYRALLASAELQFAMGTSVAPAGISPFCVPKEPICPAVLKCNPPQVPEVMPAALCPPPCPPTDGTCPMPPMAPAQ